MTSSLTPRCQTCCRQQPTPEGSLHAAALAFIGITRFHFTQTELETMKFVWRFSLSLLLILLLLLRGSSGFSTARKWKYHGNIVQRNDKLHVPSTFPNMMYFSSSLDAKESQDVLESSLRARLRKLTGFSLTAVRATLRAATGISLTAVYASTVAVSGMWIRQTMKVILGLFPSWARYFAQPFLVMYYVPLFVLRNLSAPRRRESMQNHVVLVDSWKHAVEVADQSTSYWPIHLNQNGELEKDLAELDLVDAVAESVEFALQKKCEDAEF
jgi:hypothetical protein